MVALEQVTRADGLQAVLDCMEPARIQLQEAVYALNNYVDKVELDPERLAQVRNERRPGSKYADLMNCHYEVREAETMMKKAGINWLSSTHKSIEEIAALKREIENVTKVVKAAKIEAQ